MTNIKVNAPAKINLALDITGKRDDGYHTLITIMQSISLSDIVEISLNSSNAITVSSDNTIIPTGTANIAYKAAVRFLEYTNIQHNGINIHINKNIPSEAGLGGGSADAAAVLVGLNDLLETELTNQKLCEIGVQIGADVPFCIVGGTKLCLGIGEIMKDVSPFEMCHIVIAKGEKGISTKKAFEKIDASGFEKETTYNCYNGLINSISSLGGNIFEKVADNDEVTYLKKFLIELGAEYSAMSGSGSAVFGIFKEKSVSESAIKKISDENFFAALCNPVSIGAKVVR